MLSGKQYIVCNDIGQASDMIKYVFGAFTNINCISSHTIDQDDLNKSVSIIINSNAVESIEYNF
jgi:hypothetical protein